jgi:RimJ/RimL family protein N-acetyltransferase
MDLLKDFFPMKLPSGVVGNLMEHDDAQERIKTFNDRIFPPGFKEEIGLYSVPEERQDNQKRLLKQLKKSDTMWIVFSNENEEPIGWFYGYMEDEDTYFIDTIGFVPEFRGIGLYSAFLRQMIVYLKAIGYERLATSHHPNNRAAIIADLKTGFNIVGLELHESHGPILRTALILHEDRRRAFEQGFSMQPEIMSD